MQLPTRNSESIGLLNRVRTFFSSYAPHQQQAGSYSQHQCCTQGFYLIIEEKTLPKLLLIIACMHCYLFWGCVFGVVLVEQTIFRNFSKRMLIILSFRLCLNMITASTMTETLDRNLRIICHKTFPIHVHYFSQKMTLAPYDEGQVSKYTSDQATVNIM